MEKKGARPEFKGNAYIDSDEIPVSLGDAQLVQLVVRECAAAPCDLVAQAAVDAHAGRVLT